MFYGFKERAAPTCGRIPKTKTELVSLGKSAQIEPVPWKYDSLEESMHNSL